MLKHTRKVSAWLPCVIFAVVAAVPLQMTAQADDAGKILAKMDAAAAKFQSAQADFVWDQYEKIVDEHELQSGAIYYDRKGGSTQMAAHIAKPDTKIVVYKNAELQLYQPNIDQLSIFSAGANRAQSESFLTLGFGGSGKDLASNWDVTYQGDETINGTKTAKLDLKAKQESVRKMFDHVTIWVDPDRDLTLRQQFFEPSGDLRTCSFSNIKYNAKISADVFNIKTTSKTQIVRK
jgi:outer membrane lipoprotein-sorting protein